MVQDIENLFASHDIRVMSLVYRGQISSRWTGDPPKERYPSVNSKKNLTDNRQYLGNGAI